MLRRLTDNLPPRGILFAGFTALVMCASLVEIILEFGAGEGWFEMIDDLAIFIISVGVLAIFTLDYVRKLKALSELQGQLGAMRGKFEAVDAHSRTIATQYREVMQRQFEKWQLTPSEQDVALALIKGLSFREVAEIRDTREKTVRQQAATVYKKAGLSGRHELAGWFFEDLLDSRETAVANE